MLNRGKKTIFIQYVLRLFIIYSSLFTLLNAASVEATVSNTEVVKGNAVQLRIKAIGDRAVFPDIQDVGGNSVISVSQSTSSSFDYSNGQSKREHTTTKIVTFVPQHDMRIPPYEVQIDGTLYRTKPIEIRVVKSHAPTMQKSDKFALSIRTDKERVMVGESLIATVFFSMKNGIRLSDNPQYIKPNFDGFFVKEIKEEKVYQQGEYRIQELRYILTPTKEGNFTIGPAVAKLGEPDRSRPDMFGMFFTTVWSQISSNTVQVEVVPKAKDTDLVGHFSVDTTIDTEHVKANKPVNLTVTIEGEGSLEDFDFPEYEIEGVTVYSDEAKIETKIVGDRLHSRYTKNFAFISDRDFEIPARTFSLYNTKRNKVESLEIKGYQIAVEHEYQASTTPPLTLSQPPKESIKEGASYKVNSCKLVHWRYYLLSFMSGMLLMYLLVKLPLLISEMKEQYLLKESEALTILYPHLNQDSEIEAMVRRLYAKRDGDSSIKIDKKALRAMLKRVKRLKNR